MGPLVKWPNRGGLIQGMPRRAKGCGETSASAHVHWPGRACRVLPSRLGPVTNLSITNFVRDGAGGSWRELGEQPNPRAKRHVSLDHLTI